MMTSYSRRLIGALAAAGVLCSLPIAVAGQAPARAAAPKPTNAPVAKTPWGDPDLQGIWSNTTTTTLERVREAGDKAVLSEDEREAVSRQVQERLNQDKPGAAGSVVPYNEFWYERGDKIVGSRRTSLIIDPPDGRIPALTAAAQARLDAQTAAARDEQLGVVRADSADSRSLADRCIVGFNAGPPMTPGAYNNHVQIFQNAGGVVLVTEMVHDARIVHVDGTPHLPPHLRQYKGDSRGHWEGRTLVVDTTNFLRETSFRGSSADLHLVERLTRVDADTLLYEFRVDDPKTWTKPWAASVPMKKMQEPLYEYACHEGNYAISNILSGARVQERDAGKAVGR
jgi:hypothetical protein